MTSTSWSAPSPSLGSVSGFCVNTPDFNLLRLACRPYMFTASLPPAVIASTWSSGADAGTAELRTKLMANGKHEQAQRLGLHHRPSAEPGDHQVSVPDRGLAVAFWNALLKPVCIAWRCRRTPTGTPLLRSSVSAAHTEAQIDTAIELFAKVGRQLGVLPAPRA